MLNKIIISITCCLALSISGQSYASQRLEPLATFLKTNGLPAASYKLFTYNPGTSVKKTVYKNSTLTTAFDNPIILNTSGRPPGNYPIYFSGAVKYVLAPSTDSDPPKSALYTVDNYNGAGSSVITNEYTLSGDFAGALATAATTLNALNADCTLVIDTDFTMTASVSFDSEVTLWVAPGSVITTTGYTLTVGGGPAKIIAGDTQQIFAGSGTVVFGKPGNPRADWWATNTTPGTTAMATAIQYAINSLNADAGYVLLAGVDYNIGTTSLLIKGSGQGILGDISQASDILYAGTDYAIKNDGTTVRTRCQFKDFRIINTATDSCKGIDWSYFNYSTFGNVYVALDGNNTVLWHGAGYGTSPYYNVFVNCGGSSNNDQAGAVATGSIGILYEAGDDALDGCGPNGNVWLGNGRFSSLAYAVDHRAGNGNSFYGIQSESIRDSHVRVNYGAAYDSGTSTGSNDKNSFKDTGQAWTTNAYANYAVSITGGVGSGQVRRVISNTGDDLTIYPNWTTVPDATSTYNIYKRRSVGISFNDLRMEGDSTSIGLEMLPGADQVKFFPAYMTSLSADYAISEWRPKNVVSPYPVETLTFHQENVAAAQTNVDLALQGNPSYTLGHYMPYNAYILGIVVSSSEARTAETCTVSWTDNSTEGTITAVLNADTTNHQMSFQPHGTETITVGNRLGASVTTTAGWTPVTADITVTIYYVQY